MLSSNEWLLIRYVDTAPALCGWEINHSVCRMSSCKWNTMCPVSWTSLFSVIFHHGRWSIKYDTSLSDSHACKTQGLSRPDSPLALTSLLFYSKISQFLLHFFFFLVNRIFLVIPFLCRQFVITKLPSGSTNLLFLQAWLQEKKGTVIPGQDLIKRVISRTNLKSNWRDLITSSLFSVLVIMTAPTL